MARCDRIYILCLPKIIIEHQSLSCLGIAVKSSCLQSACICSFYFLGKPAESRSQAKECELGNESYGLRDQFQSHLSDC